ncbi:MAG: aldehyde dehydrogenase family protein, partial [Bacteroidota bacterium]
MITTVNPATGKDLNHYEEYSFEKLAEIAARADEVQKHWQTTDFSHRAELMHKAAELLRQRKEDYGRLMALEMGKPLPQGIAEAEKCAWVCDYYADNAEDHLTDIPVSTEMSKSYVAFRPLGVVLAIMPWNFPFWQVFRFAAPALMAGNAGLLKHASNTMGSAVEIEKIFLEAGFPEGLFASLIVSSGPILHLIEDPNIKAVTLTGSTPVGKKVAEKAGSMLKKTVLELGGSDPYVVLADCDLDKTVDICVASRLINNGQSCISAKRFIVEKSIKGKFEVLFTERMKSKVMGYQLDKGTDIGPLARKDLMLDLHSQVERSV